MAERVPPHNFDAEQALIGSMFLSVEAVESSVGIVQPDDFYRPAHTKVFGAMQHLYSRGEPVDAVTVADRLEATGELEEVGGRPYLLTLANVVPTAANAPQYAEIVKRTSTLRELINAATQIAALGYSGPDDLGEVIERAEKLIFDVTNKRIAENFRELKSLLMEGFERIEDLYANRDGMTGVPTKFADLDRILAGLHRSDFIVLAARPSVGKTAFALNIAANAAREDFPVAVFSLEMSGEQLVQRLLCSEGQINSSRLRSGHLNDNDWTKIMQALGRLNDLPIHVDDTPAISILEIRAKARRLFRDKSTGLIIVDYLQLMQPQNRRSENRQVEIADISRGLKVLAKELDVPVMALSQLSRKVEERTDKRPVLSDLRESGAIEQDADVVMFLHRNTNPKAPVGDWDLYADARADDQPRDKTEVIVAKHRNGPTGVAPLKFFEEYTLFRSVSRKS
jgi:replicative DNA helicase